jgi:large subunit ribosomal protein L31
MREKIHPRYQTCNVHCACGNTFTTRSTQSRIAVDICAACHPFFTGKQKFVDTEGRVERFQRRYKKADAAAPEAAAPEAAAPEQPQS